MGKVRTKKPAKATLPLPQAARDFIKGWQPVRDALRLCERMPYPDGRREQEAFEAAVDAARAAKKAYLYRAANEHIGKVVEFDNQVMSGVDVEPRPLRTLDEIVMAAVIAGAADGCVAQAMPLGILKGAGVNFERDLWGIDDLWGINERKPVKKVKRRPRAKAA